MAYFSNGSEGMDYEERYCSRCVHQQEQVGGCPIWQAHMLYNYKECNKEDSILDILIPRTADGLGNEQCKMFFAKSKVDPNPLPHLGKHVSPWTE